MTGPDRSRDDVASLLDRFVPDPGQRDLAKVELLRLREREADQSPADFSLAGGDSSSADRWTSRARPTFLYVMYALLLWSIPLGLISAVRPALADAIAKGMTAYLAGIPEPLYALFGTGYLGYTVAREWGKAKGN